MSALPELDRYDALGLAERVRSGEVTAAELLEASIERAERLNPRLNAIVRPMYAYGRNALAAGIPEGPFSGVPFLLKDLLQPLGGEAMACGTGALRDYRPELDGFVVERYRRAGLVIFGKTNVPELGLVATTEPAAYGPTRNPWDPERTPGGSSGGAGAALAAGIAPIVAANDGGGSIRIPAAWCGLFGLKPSRGRVPAGPAAAEVWEGAVVDLVLSRSVRDSAAALDALAGPAAGDAFVRAAGGVGYHALLTAPLRPLRIAFSTRSPIGGPVHPECIRAVESTASLLASLGHRVEACDVPVDGMEVARAYLTLYFGQVATDVRWIRATVGDAETKRGLEETTRLLAVIGESMSAAEYIESHRMWNTFARAMARFHATYDLYLTPTTAAPPPRIGELDPSRIERLAMRVVNTLRAGGAVRAAGLPEKMAHENLSLVPFTQLANLTGQPAMSVPLHWGADGLPYGVHFVAPIGDEATLLQLAARLEEARPWWDRRPDLSVLEAGKKRAGSASEP